MENSIVEAIIRHGQEQPEKIAIIIGKEKLTYQSMKKKILQKATFLKTQGLLKGDKVVLAADPVFEYFIYYFAVHLIGAIAVPVEKRTTEEKITDILDETQPKFIKLQYDKEPLKKNEVIEEIGSSYNIESDSVADIIYTTGTTGHAKGVMLTHKNMIAGTKNVINGGEVKAEDINLLPVPLHHAYGLTTMRTILYKGGTLVIQDGFASLRAMHMNIHENGCTCAYLIPAVIPMLLQQTRDNLPALLGKLGKIEFCTAPLDIHTRKLLLKQLPNVRIYNSYGATEAARVIYLKVSEEQNKMDSIGKAVPGVQINIVNVKNYKEVLGPGRIGRLAVQGAVIMKGYYHSPNLSSQVLKNSLFLTGDIGYMDQEGYVYLLGRENDVLNIGGEKVSPQEIEDVALESGMIKECACIAKKDTNSVLGDVPVLFVVGKNPQEDVGPLLKKYLSEYLERFKIPADIISLSELPRNYMGKLDRNQLKERLKEIL